MSEQGSAASKKVYLHIGAPKTGSTAIQQFLWHNRYTLAKLGICYPLRRWNEHAAAALDVRGEAISSDEGAWNEIAFRIRDWRGPTALFSSELIGAAAPDQIAHILDSLKPAEFHVIMTARDLARQIPSDWQEQVKHRRSMPLSTFARELINGDTDLGPRYAQMFWRQHDATTLLGAWEKFVPADRIHLVTVPTSRDVPRSLLFERFMSVLGLDLGDFCLETEISANPSMGSVEAEFLRRANPMLRQRLGRSYAPIVRELLAERLLAERERPRPIRLPAPFTEEVVAKSEEIIEELSTRGYDVVGDLEELRPVLPDEDDTNPPPEAVTPAALMPVAQDVVTGLLVEILEMRAWNDALRKQVRDLRARPVTRPVTREEGPPHGSHGEGRAYLMEYGVPRQPGPRS